MVRGEEYRSRRNESKTEHQWCIQDDKKNNWEKRNATDGIKDKDGKILIDGEQVLNRWKTHTENMYSQPEDCRVLSLSDRRYSLNPLSQTRID